MVRSEISLFSLTQSRHGWHPCNYETILHLQKVRNKLADAYCLHKKISRIMNKSIPNRNQKEFRRLLANYDGRLYNQSEKTWDERMSHNAVLDAVDYAFPFVLVDWKGDLSYGDAALVSVEFCPKNLGLRRMNLYHYLEAQIAEAKRPKDKPEDVKPIVLPSNWRSILKAL